VTRDTDCKVMHTDVQIRAYNRSLTWRSLNCHCWQPRAMFAVSAWSTELLNVVYIMYMPSYCTGQNVLSAYQINYLKCNVPLTRGPLATGEPLVSCNCLEWLWLLQRVLENNKLITLHDMLIAEVAARQPSLAANRAATAKSMVILVTFGIGLPSRILVSNRTYWD